MTEFKAMRREVIDQIAANHRETNDSLIRAHQRIDILYRRES